MSDATDHSAYFRKARYRNVSFYVVWFIWLPAGVLYWWMHRSDGLTWTLGMWCIPFLWSGARFQALTCPECKHTFDQKGSKKDRSTTQCLHCGLART